MHNMMCEKSSGEILALLGQRLRAYRLGEGITLEEMAERTGLSRNTVRNIEIGEDAQVSSLIKILRVIGRLDALDDLLPQPMAFPIQLIKHAKRQRQRARKPGAPQQ